MGNLNEYIHQVRHDFAKMILDESMIDQDPVRQFEKWFQEAVEAKVNEPNAMVVSTVDEMNHPSARVVFLRGFDQNGFVFYTNYQSRKGKEIEQNPFACFTFFWPELERQIRIEGRLTKQSAADSDAYFMSRPESSRLGAWASPQSETIAKRTVLKAKLEKVKADFSGKTVIRPEWWGGYSLMPYRVEFWQGRESRLHDRIQYQKNEGSGWSISRLAP
jgi:pyridoxamine 5'-phosphate oxidase